MDDEIGAFSIIEQIGEKRCEAAGKHHRDHLILPGLSGQIGGFKMLGNREENRSFLER
jgi:hypothetical protein